MKTWNWNKVLKQFKCTDGPGCFYMEFAPGNIEFNKLLQKNAINCELKSDDDQWWKV